MHKELKHYGIKYDCDQCEYKLSNKQALKRHRDSKHSSIDTTGGIEKLDAEINQMMHKTARKNAHAQPIYACNICGKEDQGGNIKSHIRSNHIEKTKRLSFV